MGSMADPDAPAVTETPAGIEVHQKMEKDEDDEDAAIQLALQMSREPDNDNTQQEQQFQDPNFVNQLLGSLPGVDSEDPAIKNALKKMKTGEGDEENGKTPPKKDDSKDS